MPTAQDYKVISRRKMDEMLDEPGVGVEYRPLGMFVCVEEVDGEWVYTAMDNRDGQALTEDFITKRAAVRWLHGHPVTENQKYRGKSRAEQETERRIARLKALVQEE